MLFAIISYIPLSSVGVPENSPQSCYQRNCWPFSAFCRPWVPACVKKLPWFTCCALGFKVNPKTIWQNLLKALWIIHGLLVTDCTAADFTGNTLLITTGFFKHERVHSCKKQKTHHAHTHTNCPSPVVSFWRPSNPPPQLCLPAAGMDCLFDCFRVWKKKTWWLWTSVGALRVSWVEVLACGNHYLTLCTHKRSWRVGCHGNSGSFGYGCVS